MNFCSKTDYRWHNIEKAFKFDICGQTHQVVEVALAPGPLAHPVAEQGMLDPELLGHFRNFLVVVVVAVVDGSGIVLLVDEL